MRDKPTTFEKLQTGEFASALEDWVDLIPADTPCIVATYKQGEEVGASGNKPIFNKISSLEHPFGIVLGGRVEILETYCANKFTAYRPIRIMKQKEIIGDFGLIDKCHGLREPLGETWRISAGFKSFIVVNNVDKLSLCRFKEPRTRGVKTTGDIITHLYFDEVIDHVTTIVFIEGNFIQQHSDIYYKLLDYSWPHVKRYRDALNSYNYNAKLIFKSEASEVAYELLNKEEYKSAVRIKDILPLFLDVIWDLYNRPIRNEPMFATNPDIKFVNNEAKKGGLNLKHSDFICSMETSLLNEFWFPIDFANYIFASHSINDAKIEDGVKKVLMAGGQRECKDNKQYNSRKYYEHLANLLFQEVIPANYEFSVNCVETEGGLYDDYRHLLLHFVKNTVEVGNE